MIPETLFLFSDPEMLNIGIARVRIPDCCNECQDSEEDDRSVCSCSTAENLGDIESTISAETQTMLHNVVPEALNEGKCWVSQKSSPHLKKHHILLTRLILKIRFVGKHKYRANVFLVCVLCKNVIVEWLGCLKCTFSEVPLIII